MTSFFFALLLTICVSTCRSQDSTGSAKQGAMAPEKGPMDGPEWWSKNTPWVGGQVQQPYWPTTVLNGYALNYHTAVNNAVSFGNALGNGPEAPAVSVTPPGTVFNCALPTLCMRRFQALFSSGFLVSKLSLKLPNCSISIPAAVVERPTQLASYLS